MKHISLIIFICLAFFNSKGQDLDHYYFETDDAPYQNLIDDTVIISDPSEFSLWSWDAKILNFKLKTYFEPDHYGFGFSTNGDIEFDLNNNTSEKDTILTISPLSITTNGYGQMRFLENKPSSISYKIEQLANDRRLIIQYRNLSYKDSLPNDSINFQVHLYESGNIEYHYGPSHIEELSRISRSPYKMPYIYFGARAINYDFDELHLLYGDPAAPQVFQKNDFKYTLDTFPKIGQIYRFVYKGEDVSTKPPGYSKQLDIKIEANSIHLSGENFGYRSVEIVELSSGRIVYSGETGGKDAIISTENFTTGVYFIRAFGKTSYFGGTKFFKP